MNKYINNNENMKNQKFSYKKNNSFDADYQFVDNIAISIYGMR